MVRNIIKNSSITDIRIDELLNKRVDNDQLVGNSCLSVQSDNTINTEFESESNVGRNVDYRDLNYLNIKDNCISAPTSIIIEDYQTPMFIGEKYQLKAKIEPSTTDQKNVIWASSDETILQVDSDGELLAKKVGSATITATTSNGKTHKVFVVVKNGSGSISEVKSIYISNKDDLKNLLKGDQKTVKVKLVPEKSINGSELSFKSSNYFKSLD